MSGGSDNENAADLPIAEISTETHTRAHPHRQCSFQQNPDFQTTYPNEERLNDKETDRDKDSLMRQ